MNKQRIGSIAALAFLLVAGSARASAQAVAGADVSPSFGSINTPRPVNPASETTNPSARAGQSLNPYLGSASDDVVVDHEIQLSLLQMEIRIGQQRRIARMIVMKMRQDDVFHV